MAAAAAAPPAPAAGAGERLAAALQALGDALSLEAQAGLPPGVQELVGSWDVRTQALVRAATGGADGGLLQAAEATAAAELLQPLLSEAFVSAHPDLFDGVLDAGGAIARCCSREAYPLYFGPVGASFLGLFVSEQLSRQVRYEAAQPLVVTLGHPGWAAALLAAAGGDGAVDGLIAAVKREGDLLQGSAFWVLAELAGDDDSVRARVASADVALLPLAVERMSAAAAGAASPDALYVCRGALRLLSKFTAGSIPDAARAHALATPGLAAAAVDLLMALGSEEWAMLRQEWTVTKEERAPSWEELEAAILMMLMQLMWAGGVVYASAFDALTSRGALPRVLALLQNPRQGAGTAACRCIAAFADTDAGRDALFLVPRAASELAAALRRAHADGEDPSLTQYQAARALSQLRSHSQGSRVADGLVRAAVVEGSAGSLLGALARILTASVDGGESLGAR